MNAWRNLIQGMYEHGYSKAAAVSACKLHGFKVSDEQVAQLYDELDEETEYREDNPYSGY